MKSLVKLLGILVAILIVLWGIGLASVFVRSPEYGLPTIVIGVALLLFILIGTRRLAVSQTFVVIVGTILLVVGVSWMEKQKYYWWEPIAWPGFIFIFAGVVVVLFHRSVLNSIRRAGEYLWRSIQKNRK